MNPSHAKPSHRIMVGPCPDVPHQILVPSFDVANPTRSINYLVEAVHLIAARSSERADVSEGNSQVSEFLRRSTSSCLVPLIGRLDSFSRSLNSLTVSSLRVSEAVFVSSTVSSSRSLDSTVSVMTVVFGAL